MSNRFFVHTNKAGVQMVYAHRILKSRIPNA
jgi:hypothetical protein